MLYMVTFTINIPPMLAYIPDPMGLVIDVPGPVTSGDESDGHGDHGDSGSVK